MKRLLLVVFCLPLLALAHQPAMVAPTDYNDTVVVEDPSLSQAFYGALDDFPHTYAFTLSEAQSVFVEVLVPDIEEVQNDRGAIIVRQMPTGRVEEVTRLKPADATWESFYEPFGGDLYRRGPSFEQELAAGSYLVEVSTNENQGKYVLVIGTREDFGNLGYFGTVKRIFAVKQFFGKSPIAAVQSPLITVPLILLLLVFYSARRYYKKHYA